METDSFLSFLVIKITPSLCFTEIRFSNWELVMVQGVWQALFLFVRNTQQLMILGLIDRQYLIYNLIPNFIFERPTI